MSAPTLDDRKAYVLGRVDMQTLATNSGATLKGRSPRGKCPFCGGGGFAIVKAKGSSLLNRWRCYSACDAGGNAIDFLMKRDSVPFFDALRSLERDVGGLAEFTPAVREQLHRKRLAAERVSAETAERKRRFALERIGETLRDMLPLTPDTLAWRYLEDRGLDMAGLVPRLLPDALGFHPAVGHWKDWDPQARGVQADLSRPHRARDEAGRRRCCRHDRHAGDLSRPAAPGSTPGGAIADRDARRQGARAALAAVAPARSPEAGNRRLAWRYVPADGTARGRRARPCGGRGEIARGDAALWRRLLACHVCREFRDGRARAGRARAGYVARQQPQARQPDHRRSHRCRRRCRRSTHASARVHGPRCRAGAWI